jgi:hypothetical protein
MYSASVVEPYPTELWSLTAANNYVRRESEEMSKIVRENNIKVTPTQ